MKIHLKKKKKKTLNHSKENREMGGSGGLQLREDSVGMGLIGGREVGGGVGRRHGSVAWGLGRLGPVTLRPAEAWVGEHEVTERETRVTEREREAFLLF